ncbi:YihY/virulence factor BrkB family protein [Halovulum dunhuangense]|uniref:YihY/virulence factor BrkB family protein n=1 Tax=Halovulum dunhuangense TaxID=1505036 RepID=A0A849KU24_9RHOB|nr:YihY/virulence factor BrkB family protein [Halovulum dunhuangense]NNU79071.1 YihY/virulence factor BrkB family protein [Halovulum dunhuangense]
MRTLVYKRERFGLADWWNVLRRVIAGTGQKQLALLSAGVAFFAMLALFPGIAAVISLFGVVSDPIAVQQSLELVAPVVPEQVYALIHQQVSSVVLAPRQALGAASALSIVLATWSARAGVGAMVMGLNAIHRSDASRNILGNLIVAYSLTILLICVTLVAVAAVVVLPAVLAYVPLGPYAGMIIDLLRWAAAVATVAFGIGALYRFGPARKGRRLPMLTLGSLFATVLWVAVSMAFSFYLGNFANYNQVYGSLGAVIALLMWFYVSAFVVLLGAELNEELEEHAIARIRARQPALDPESLPITRREPPDAFAD